MPSQSLQLYKSDAKERCIFRWDALVTENRGSRKRGVGVHEYRAISPYCVCFVAESSQVTNAAKVKTGFCVSVCVCVCGVWVCMK